MKIRRDTGRKSRINYGFFGMTVDGPGNWWYNRDLRRWELEPKHGWNNYATWQPCHSVRAFRRLLKDAPRGVRFKLESVWKGRDAHGTGSKQTGSLSIMHVSKRGPKNAVKHFKNSGEAFEHLRD